MTPRRKGTIPQRIMLTPDIVKQIDRYQAQYQIPSFSAAAEVLLRRGLEHAPTEIITPIIASTIRQAVHRELDRLIRIQIYTAIDAGMSSRFAAAAFRDIGRLKGDAPERYQQIKAMIRADTRRRIAHGEIDQVLTELLQEQDDVEDEGDGADGDRESKLPQTRAENETGGETGRPLLHVS